MPRVIDPTKLDHAAALYATGKTFAEAAAEIGHGEEVVRLALRRRGIKARPKVGRLSPQRFPVDPEAIAAYQAGESELSLSKRFGVNRGVVARWLEEAGVARRGSSEANPLRMARLSPEERAEIIAALHDTIRGSHRTEEQQVRIAAGRERAAAGGNSPGCDQLCVWLAERAIEHVREKAVGKYNVDIALSASPVAVEVLGGYWHQTKRTHATRTPYLLNRGWHVVFVWDIQRFPIEPGAADYLVAYAQEASRNPAAVGEYRVIRGDGELITVGRADDDEFALVPPTKALLHRRT